MRFTLLESVPSANRSVGSAKIFVTNDMSKRIPIHSACSTYGGVLSMPEFSISRLRHSRTMRMMLKSSIAIAATHKIKRMGRGGAILLIISLNMRPIDFFLSILFSSLFCGERAPNIMSVMYIPSRLYHCSRVDVHLFNALWMLRCDIFHSLIALSAYVVEVWHVVMNIVDV